MKISSKAIGIVAGLVTVTSASRLPAIQIDLGPSRVVHGETDRIPFSDLNGLPVSGSLSVDFFFADSQFVRLFTATTSDFDALIILQTNRNGLVGFLDGTAYLLDAFGNPIPGYGIVGSASSDTGWMGAGFFPLFKDENGTPNTDLARPVTFYGIHFDLIFPAVDPSIELTGSQFFLADGIFGIGPNTFADIVPDGGSSLTLFALAFLALAITAAGSSLFRV